MTRTRRTRAVVTARAADTRRIALLRGINVGRARRIAMADLRALVAGLGYADVQTLLNSGNVVFTARVTPAAAARRIEKALVERLGVSSRVTVLATRELAAAVDENPLPRATADPSRFLLAFLADPADRARLEPLARRDWGREALALGPRVVYLWCPEGIIDSEAQAAVARALGDGVTARNWTTVTKLLALAQAAPPTPSAR